MILHACMHGYQQVPEERSLRCNVHRTHTSWPLHWHHVYEFASRCGEGIRLYFDLRSRLMSPASQQQASSRGSRGTQPGSQQQRASHCSGNNSPNSLVQPDPAAASHQIAYRRSTCQQHLSPSSTPWTLGSNGIADIIIMSMRRTAMRSGRRTQAPSVIPTSSYGQASMTSAQPPAATDRFVLEKHHQRRKKKSDIIKTPRANKTTALLRPNLAGACA